MRWLSGERGIFDEQVILGLASRSRRRIVWARSRLTASLMTRCAGDWDGAAGDDQPLASRQGAPDDIAAQLPDVARAAAPATPPCHTTRWQPPDAAVSWPSA